MKVGVMTWWRNTNYGGCLQALALQSFLCRLNVDVEMVDYRVRQSLGRNFDLKDIYCARDWRTRIWAIVALLVRVGIARGVFVSITRQWVMFRFIRNHFFIGKACSQTSSTLSHSLEGYDVIVVGSDQVWNPEWLDDGGYLLRGVGSPLLRRIAYAASLGKSDIPSKLKSLYRECLERFDAISLREQAGVRALSDIIEKPVFWVVDPTLLLSPAEWRRLLDLSPDPKIQDGVFCYCLSELSPLFKAIEGQKKISAKRFFVYTDSGNKLSNSGAEGGAFFSKILEIFTRFRISWFTSRVCLCFCSDARDFVCRLCNANRVVTDSFHALMFSVIFQRDVKVVIPESRSQMASRIEDFLDYVGLENVIARDWEGAFAMKKTVYTEKSMQRLREWVEYSKTWLKSALMSE